MAKPPSADGREIQRPQDSVADIGYDLAVRVSRLRAQLLPFRIATESAPKLVARRHALKRQHIRQVRQVAAHQRLAEENRRHAQALEDGGFALIEHADL